VRGQFPPALADDFGELSGTSRGQEPNSHPWHMQSRSRFRVGAGCWAKQWIDGAFKATKVLVSVSWVHQLAGDSLNVAVGQPFSPPSRSVTGRGHMPQHQPRQPNLYHDAVPTFCHSRLQGQTSHQPVSRFPSCYWPIPGECGRDVWVDSSPHTQQLRGRWYPSCSMDGLWTAPVGLALILRSLLRLTFIIVGRRTHLSYGTAVLRYS
jgi:hypothetical protein